MQISPGFQEAPNPNAPGEARQGRYVPHVQFQDSRGVQTQTPHEEDTRKDQEVLLPYPWVSIILNNIF